MDWTGLDSRTGLDSWTGLIFTFSLFLTCTQERRKQCEAAGAAISKGHLLSNHHFSVRQYLLKIYCMDTRLLVTIMGNETSTLILNNFICCTMLRAQNKISKLMYIA
jgi:hypothetical protein